MRAGLGASRANRQLLLATGAFVLAFAVWGLMAPLAPEFRRMYDLSAFETALVVAIPLILGAILRIPVGVLADRYGGRIVFASLLFASAVPCAAIAFAHSYWMILICAFLLGSAGSTFAAGVSYVSRWYPPQKQGTALGIFGLGNVGLSVATYCAPQISQRVGWQWVFWIFSALSVAAGVLFLRFSADPPAKQSTSMRHIFDVLLHRRLSWVFSFFCFITLGGFVALGVYLPILLTGQFGLSLEMAGTYAACFALIGACMRPVGGWLADKIRGETVLLVVFSTLSVLAWCLASEALSVFLTAAFASAAVFGLGNGAVFRLVPRYFSHEVGAVTGLVGALGGLGGFFPPVVMGIVRENTGSYWLGFVFLSMSAAVALCLVISVFMVRKYRRQELAAA